MSSATIAAVRQPSSRYAYEPAPATVCAASGAKRKTFGAGLVSVSSGAPDGWIRNAVAGCLRAYSRRISPSCGSSGPTIACAPRSSTRWRATGITSSFPETQPISSSTGRPAILAPATPLDGCLPAKLPPRSSNGSSADATLVSYSVLNGPKQSVRTPIRNASGLEPPQPAPSHTVATTMTARPARARIAARPDRPLTDRHRPRTGRHADGGDDPVRGRIDARYGVVDGVRDPHAACSGGDSHRAPADRDGGRDAVRRRVDRHSTINQLIGEPDR